MTVNEQELPEMQRPEHLANMRRCAPLLPPPGDREIIKCLDEIDRLRALKDVAEIAPPQQFEVGVHVSGGQLYVEVWVLEGRGKRIVHKHSSDLATASVPKPQAVSETRPVAYEHRFSGGRVAISYVRDDLKFTENPEDIRPLVYGDAIPHPQPETLHDWSLRMAAKEAGQTVTAGGHGIPDERTPPPPSDAAQGESLTDRIAYALAAYEVWGGQITPDEALKDPDMKAGCYGRAELIVEIIGAHKGEENV